MQIVIDIDDKIYNRIISWKENTICDSENPYIAKAIKNGTPLPNGHGRLIDAVKDKSAEEIYDFLNWLMRDYGMRFTDTRLAVIEWLKGERE